MDIDLHTMSLSDLKKLQKNVASAITNFEARKRDEAIAELREVAKKHGFDFSELAGGKKSAKAPSAARYRDPSDPSKTWTGRGRKPNWLVEALDNGKEISEFAI